MKFPTIVLAVGAAVLLLAVVIGQRMGDRVMQQATQAQLNSVIPTPLPTGADTSPAALRPGLEALGGALRRGRPPLSRPSRAAAAGPDAAPRNAQASADAHPGPDGDDQPQHPDLASEAASGPQKGGPASSLGRPNYARACPLRRRDAKRAAPALAAFLNVFVGCGCYDSAMEKGTVKVKRGLAQMLKGGVIMDVVTPEHAAIAQEAGAVAVMALERIPADIRAAGGVARMSAIDLIRGIMDAVTIPVMAKVRIGHFAEAQVLQQLGVDYIDESEVLTPADDKYHVEKHAFTTPFVCGARDLGEALRRITEGAAMIRSKGEAGSGNIVEAVRHMRAIGDSVRELSVAPKEELVARARDLGAPYELVVEVAQNGKLPVVLFCAGGVATPADAALMMQLGAEGIFVGSGIFKSKDPKRFARAIVDATTHFNDPSVVLEACRSLGQSEAMPGLDVRQLPEAELMAPRGNYPRPSFDSPSTSSG